eukprot:gene3248-5691_t
MSVYIQTTVGDFVVDLFFEKCPKACENFINLCKIKYYNNCLFFNVQKDFLAQTGDPTNTGTKGTSIFGLLDGKPKGYFKDEFHKDLKHNKMGLLSYSNTGKHTNTSQFFVTLTNKHLDHLDSKNTLFGEVVEGLDIISKFNDIFTNENGKPFQEVRIYHTIILIDPFEHQLKGVENLIPPNSPEPIQDKYLIDANINIENESMEKYENVEEKNKRELESRAVMLEIAGDLPDSDLKPPDTTLFVCKLNPITTEDGLDIIFGRFGEIKEIEIIRDRETNRSLGFAFIDFENKSSCEMAYLKTENIIIDDRRIHVDFSQSVAKLWNKKNRDSKRHKKKYNDKDYKKRKYENDDKYNDDRDYKSKRYKDDRKYKDDDYKRSKKYEYDDERKKRRDDEQDYRRNDDRDYERRRRRDEYDYERRRNYY